MKYELTEQTKTLDDGTVLYRIKALRDIPVHGVKAGDLGGWVEGERNLSQDGDSWVYGDEDTRVYGNALVCGNARVYGDAQVSDDAWVFGDAWVCGNARVHGNARVSDYAQVFDDAETTSGHITE